MRRGNILPARALVTAWSLLILIALLAWALTTAQAGDMGIEPGTMGMGVPLFLLLWLLMMIAMMLPSVAPVAITWARGISRRSTGMGRVARTAEFIGGYLLVWTAFGLLAYGGFAVTGDIVHEHPGAGRWIGFAAFLLAALQQLGPLKSVCLRHCRSPMSQLMRYAGFRREWARELRVGAHHGLYCVGCCWGLMVVLIPLGAMNVAAMAGVAAVIFIEKLWRLGPWFSTVVGLVLLVLAGLAPSQPWLTPGLQSAHSPMHMN
jgi:predicted metal-binding membrane protein